MQAGTVAIGACGPAELAGVVLLELYGGHERLLISNRKAGPALPGPCHHLRAPMIGTVVSMAVTP
ncbi:hypothetical protein D3C78_1982880 [compost metagenome]